MHWSVPSMVVAHQYFCFSLGSLPPVDAGSSNRLVSVVPPSIGAAAEIGEAVGEAVGEVVGVLVGAFVAGVATGDAVGSCVGDGVGSGTFMVKYTSFPSCLKRRGVWTAKKKLVIQAPYRHIKITPCSLPDDRRASNRSQ